MLKTSQNLSRNLLGTARSVPIEHYDKFQCNPDGYDRDFLQQRDEDPNTTLTSVRDFPASASGTVLICYSGGSLVCSYSTGFIVNVQNDPESAFQGRNRALFKTVAGPTLTGANALPPPFEYGCASRHIHRPVELAIAQRSDTMPRSRPSFESAR